MPFLTYQPELAVEQKYIIGQAFRQPYYIAMNKSPTHHLHLIVALLLGVSAPHSADAGPPIPPPPVPNALVSAPGTIPTAQPLFLDVEVGASQPAINAPPYVLRERSARLNPESISVSATQFVLNLFTNATYDVVVEHAEINRFATVLYGHIARQPQSRVIIASRNGVCAASITTMTGQFFKVRYGTNGWHTISEIDLLKVRNPLASSDVLEPPAFLVPSSANSSTPQDTSASLPMSTVTTAGTLSGTTTPTLDILVLYTSAAASAAGGADAIKAVIALAEAQMNDAFQNSLITARVRVVETVGTIYTESGSVVTDLAWLASDANTEQVRNYFGADLVSLFVSASRDGYAGVAYLYQTGCNQQIGQYSAMVQSGADFYDFAHELGHNLGCNHDRPNKWTCSCINPDNCQAFPYSYGYSFTVPSPYNFTAHTIMFFQGGTIPNYSNPNVSYYNVPTGISATDPANSADNATTINNTAGIVAAYRMAVTCSSPALDAGGSQFSFQVTGPIGTISHISYTSDFQTWTGLGDYPLNGGTAQVVDYNVTGVGYRFYSASSDAVLGDNSVGFIRIVTHPTYQMFANQFNNPSGNTLSVLIPASPNGSIVYKWDDTTQQYVSGTFLTGSGWIPDLSLNPGEGAMMASSTPVTITLVG